MEEAQEKTDQDQPQEEKPERAEEEKKIHSAGEASPKEDKPKKSKPKLPSFGEVWLRLKILIACLIIIALVFFISQNVEPTRVKFLFWETNISVSLLIILSAALGAAALGIMLVRPKIFLKK